MDQDFSDTQAGVDEILFDCRSLQQRVSISGRLAEFDLALISAIRHRDWPGIRPKLIGLVDPGAEPLRDHHSLFFDEITTGRHRAGWRSRCFISSAPMAHDPVWALPILLDPRIFKVAAVHELISVETHAGSRSALERRADYLTCLAWLGRYDLFAVGSRAIEAELMRLRRIEPSRILIAGRVVSSAFVPNPTDPSITYEDRRHVAVTVGSGAPKDLEGVLTAHAHSEMRQRYPLAVIGSCSSDLRARLRTHYGREGGTQGDLRFVDGRPSGEIRDSYRCALLMVIPSWGSEVEIASALESAAMGTPVAVPEPGRQVDLDAVAPFTYPRGDWNALASLFDAIAGDRRIWEDARVAGAIEACLPSADTAARRLLNALVERIDDHQPAPAVGRGSRPRLALLSPMPPTATCSAIRSAATIQALVRYAEVHAFSDTPGAVSVSSALPIAPIHTRELCRQQFDASLCVLGNSRHHTATLEYLLANGGAALTHDAHLVGLYVKTFGLDRTLDVGRAEHGGALSQEQVLEWTREPRDMPILFMSEVARAAAPLLVTSGGAQREVARLYGTESKLLPPLQHRHFDTALLTTEQRRIRREALGWTPDEVVLCSSGLDYAAVAVVVWALRLLRDWRLDARLALYGRHDAADRARIDRLAQELDVAQWMIRSSDGLAYTDALVAADLAVQLGTNPLSGPSEAMMDCIAASLPTIANDHIAHTVAAPSFVRRVPDALSPVLIAEAVLELVLSGQHRVRSIEEARAFAEAHSPDRYARALLAALGLGHGTA